MPAIHTTNDARHATGEAVLCGGPFPQTRAARWLMPYGVWTCADNRAVLFNRRYQPILQRSPGGQVEPANPREWVRWTSERFFYSGQHTEAECRERAAAALRAWGVPAPHTSIQGGRA